MSAVKNYIYENLVQISRYYDECEVTVDCPTIEQLLVLKHLCSKEIDKHVKEIYEGE